MNCLISIASNIAFYPRSSREIDTKSFTISSTATEVVLTSSRLGIKTFLGNF